MPKIPITILMITFNEEHNMEGVLENILNFASQIIILDSFSTDRTVDIANSYGVQIFQRKFINFGDQWNYACKKLPISQPWTMKLDPDERLTEELKKEISINIYTNSFDYAIVPRRLWFMNKPLAVTQNIERIWRTGECNFDDVEVNENPILSGKKIRLRSHLEHFDSPNLHHWFNKQNIYSTLEAKSLFLKKQKKIFNFNKKNNLTKKNVLRIIYNNIIFRNQLVFVYCYLFLGAFRSGKVGYIWARMRSEVYRMRNIKYLEMKILKRIYLPEKSNSASPSVYAKTIND